MAAQASPSEGPTSSVGASTVTVEPDAPEPSLEPPAAASAPPRQEETLTTPDPLVLVKKLIRTTMTNIRLGKDQRCNAVRKWYAESGLDAVNAANQTTPAERSALVKAVVERWWWSSPLR